MTHTVPLPCAVPAVLCKAEQAAVRPRVLRADCSSKGFPTARAAGHIARGSAVRLLPALWAARRFLQGSCCPVSSLSPDFRFLSLLYLVLGLSCESSVCVPFKEPAVVSPVSASLAAHLCPLSPASLPFFSCCGFSWLFSWVLATDGCEHPPRVAVERAT